jgi:ABC-type transport system involved in cytochrome c biogenesis permease subunit
VFAVPVIIFAAGIFSGLRKPDEHNGFRMDLLGRIPVVHLGRAKPLDSVARSIVRRSSGVESVNKGDEESTRIDAVAWLADSMFGGKDFADYRLFKIDDPNLRGSLSLVESRKRYRYSINEVEKAEVELQKLFDNAEAKPEEQRSAFDHRTAELWQLLAESRALSGLLNVDWDGKKVLELYYEIVLPDMTRRQAMLIAPLPNEKEAWGQLSVALFCQQVLDRAQRFGVTTCTELAKRVVAEEKDTVREQEIRAGVFQQLTSDDAIRQQAGDMSAQQWRLFVFKQIRQAPLTELEKMAGPIVAAVDKNIEASLADQARAIAENLRKWFGNEELAAVSMPYDVRRLFDLKTAYQANDKTKFNGALESYLASIEKSPPQGIVGWRQTLEGFFNRFSPYYLATICYLGGFLFTVLAWIVAPLWLNRVATAVLFGGWLLHLTGIIMSIGISGRAPVTGLYSSFVFVTCVVVGVFMAVERFTRMGLGNLLGSVLGVGGLLWAWNIALGTEDVFAVLVAVLDTNFWLSTHVICVSLGYSATLAAGALGVTYVLGGLLTQSLTASRRLQLTRLIYGTVCFGLLFSFVGTVLGGLWADDSWGRFWGWDPKENGALIIVLWNAVVLHARWGGLVRDRGMAGLAVIGNAVTAWSWEGVNQLGVGLHAYALSDANKFRMLLAFWVAQLVIAGLALIPPQYWLSKPDAKKTAPVLDDVRRGRNRS